MQTNPQKQLSPPLTQPQPLQQSPSLLKLVLSCIRLLPLSIIMCSIILFQEYIRPKIMISFIRRYISCIVNLVGIRLVLLLLGFFKFQTDNYRFFNRMEKKLTFRSGWVGVAPRKSIIEFLYYCYMFNPTYVQVIEYHEENPAPNSEPKIFYTPLSFKQALFAALSTRGFDPIILRGQRQLKRYKKRKMMMQTLISECFEEMNGPILIFLPSQGFRKNLRMHKTIGEDIFDNQRRFVRSGVVFITDVIQNVKGERETPQFCLKEPENQLLLMIDLCVQWRLNIFSVATVETIKNKYEYHRATYCQFVDEIFKKYEYEIIDKNYQTFLHDRDQVVEQLEETHQMQEEKAPQDQGDREDKKQPKETVNEFDILDPQESSRILSELEESSRENRRRLHEMEREMMTVNMDLRRNFINDQSDEEPQDMESRRLIGDHDNLE